MTREARIIDLLERDGPLTRKEIEGRLGIPWSLRLLYDMERRKAIERSGQLERVGRRGRPRIVWRVRASETTVEPPETELERERKAYRARQRARFLQASAAIRREEAS